MFSGPKTHGFDCGCLECYQRPLTPEERAQRDAESLAWDQERGIVRDKSGFGIPILDVLRRARAVIYKLDHEQTDVKRSLDELLAWIMELERRS